MLVVLVGCAADAPVPPSEPVITIDEAHERPSTEMDTPADSVDMCALAAALPADDICRHLCDPPAMADQLEADGAELGACYQLYCQLTETVHALAGVCVI